MTSRHYGRWSTRRNNEGCLCGGGHRTFHTPRPQVIRAARALADMDQGTLAKRAGIDINTVSAMEKKGAEGLTSGLDKVRAVMTVLEAEGIEFLNHGSPGVRLKAKP